MKGNEFSLIKVLAEELKGNERNFISITWCHFGLIFVMLGLAYLDHAGSTLYSELQMEAVFRDLTTNVYGNPHILLCKLKCFCIFL